jgi:uncharacterized protein YhfF
LGLATPGPLRDRLNALVLSGTKTATAGLWQQDYVDESEPLEQVGEREVLLDSNGEPLGHIDVLRVEVRRFIEVSLEFALAEGEGCESIEHWRRDHRTYWTGAGIVVDDDTHVVCLWFRVLTDKNGTFRATRNL